MPPCSTIAAPHSTATMFFQKCNGFQDWTMVLPPFQHYTSATRNKQNKFDITLIWPIWLQPAMYWGIASYLWKVNSVRAVQSLTREFECALQSSDCMSTSDTRVREFHRTATTLCDYICLWHSTAAPKWKYFWCKDTPEWNFGSL